MSIIIAPEFFDRKATLVAKELLGCYLVRKYANRIEKYLITETEAYDGEKDLACHASKGRTKRTEVLYGEPGILYVYFTYGIHWLLNVVVGPKDYPAGVLIRGIQGLNGPARITKKLEIDSRLHGKCASRKNGLWFEYGINKINPRQIIKSSRIGVDYAGSIWSKKKYRFILRLD